MFDEERLSEDRTPVIDSTLKDQAVERARKTLESIQWQPAGEGYEIASFDKVIRGAPTREASRRRSIAVDRIRNRDEHDVAHNERRASDTIETFYLNTITESTTKIGRLLKLRQLRKRADQFHETFDELLFADIEHVTPHDIGETATLQSVQERAQNADVEISNQGYIDDAVGNLDYVFANAKGLKSYTGSSAKYAYRIESDDGYAVPMDMTDVYPAIGNSEHDYQGAQLELYADNVFSIPDFKKVFALYAAALFDSPEDALGYYQAFRHSIRNGRWDHVDGDHAWAIHADSGSGGYEKYMQQDQRGHFISEPNETAAAIALRMKQLAERGVYPPMEPEFQFRRQVEASRVED